MLIRATARLARILAARIRSLLRPGRSPLERASGQHRSVAVRRGRPGTPHLGVPLAAAAALGFAVIAIARNHPEPVITEPPYPPAPVPFHSGFAAAGVVEANTQNVKVSTPVPGLVVVVSVQAGDNVNSGDLLFQLDDRDLQAELQVKRAALQVARSRLERLQATPRPEEIPVLQARVQEADTRLTNARLRLQRMRSVLDQRAISREELAERAIAMRTAAARAKEARAALTLLKAGPSPEDIATSRAELHLAESQVRRIETAIARLSIRAPVSGKILQVNVHTGEYAGPGQVNHPLMLLGGTRPLHVRVEIDELELPRFQRTALAIAVPRGQTQLRLPLHLVNVEPYVSSKHTLSGDNLDRVDTRVLQVVYRIEDSVNDLYVGQLVDVFINASTAEMSATAGRISPPQEASPPSYAADK